MSQNKKVHYTCILVVLSLLFASAENRADAQDNNLQADGPTYGVRGQYPVGTRDFVIKATHHWISPSGIRR